MNKLLDAMQDAVLASWRLALFPDGAVIEISGRRRPGRHNCAVMEAHPTLSMPMEGAKR